MTFELSETAFVFLTYLIILWIVGVAAYIVYVTISRREELLDREPPADDPPSSE